LLKKSHPTKQFSVMPTMKSFINSLKGNFRGSEKSVTTGPKTEEGEAKAYVSKFELLGENSYQYINYLKPLNTDISFEDLTATLNHLHGKDYSTDQIADSFTSTCEFWKRLVRKGEANFKLTSRTWRPRVLSFG
ncbi:MAG: hypothetical protein Q9204_006919, partial [Flavoplaca sp. TL-2023a]